MKTNSLLIVLAVLGVAGIAHAKDPAIDTALARQYFNEARQLCARDNGALWGISLYGPMMFVDPASRMVVANQADTAGLLTASNGIAVGRLPEEVNIANTATDWNGLRWSTVIWPLPPDREVRDVIMTHELWHRIQDSIGFPASMPGNAHLDTPDGRLWMQLEWRALDSALADSGAQRRTAIQDALIFRAQRRSLFAEAAADEHALEMNEGLAQYTGFEVGLPSDEQRIKAAKEELQHAPEKKSFVRAFAYASGPAYCLLLDALGTNWRADLTAADDLADLTQAAYAIEQPDDLQATAMWRATRYGGDSIRTAETMRETERQARLSAWRAKLVDGPVLHIPLRQMNISFDPRTVQPLGDDGTVYPSIRVSDVWGVLDVGHGGALLASTFTMITVPAPSGIGSNPLTGDGWTLELGDGWVVLPGVREGDYEVVEVK